MNDRRPLLNKLANIGPTQSGASEGVVMYVFGLDCGGTSTEALLATTKGEILGKG